MSGRTVQQAILGGLILCLAGLFGPAAPVRASETVAETATELGPVTNLPLPRYVSIKVKEANVRRGPSLSHRIDWVYQRRHLPVQITAEYGNWRRIRDIEGAGGWVHYSLLSGSRYVLVTGADAMLWSKPEAGSLAVARAEPGVIAELGDCTSDWCEVEAGGLDGWIRKDQVWGVDPGEIRD